MYGMSNYQLNEYLEVIAMLIIESAKTPVDAAKIVREAKIAGATIEPDTGNMSDDQFQAIRRMQIQLCSEIIAKSDSIKDAEKRINETFFANE